jgi:hypothetical protein
MRSSPLQNCDLEYNHFWGDSQGFLVGISRETLCTLHNIIVPKSTTLVTLSGSVMSST